MLVDVAVIGGGPAGSTAARVCAEQGLQVAIIDKATFPRDKPCGGGVNLRAAQLLPFDIAPVVEREIKHFRFSLRRSSETTLHSQHPITLLTRRSRLDHFLLEKAVQSGAQLFEGSEIRSVTRGSSSIEVLVGSQPVRARAVVAADGANGKTARLAGFDLHPLLCVGLEGSLDYDGLAGTEWEHQIAIDYGRIPGGYGWVFPKSDHLNVGVYGWRRTAKTLREELTWLAASYGFDLKNLHGVKGHHLPLRRVEDQLVKDNVLLVGDAAGLIDPFLGEGIYSAIWSGNAAAQEICNWMKGNVPDLMGYQVKVNAFLDAEHQASARFYSVLNRFPWLGVRYFQTVPAAWNMLSALLRGDETYQGMRRKMGYLTLGIDAAFRIFRSLPGSPERFLAVSPPEAVPLLR